MFLAAISKFEVILRHVMGKNNRIPDILSRMHNDVTMHKEFERIKKPDWRRVVIDEEKFQCSISW